jgi:molybdopterin-containing oxidoreductase family membrane subunit
MSTATLTLKPFRPASLLFVLWLGILAALMVWGLVSGIDVLRQGLVVTGLSDLVPWGLWIALDLSSISLGAGAFIFSAVVYLLGLKQFQAFARVAVLVGFLGYSSAMLALLLDIGRPDRFWLPVISPNIHSVLWEITMCVIFYFTVLAAEMAPVVLESKFFARWPNAAKIGESIHKATPVLAVFGLFLSLLHQSSLGATYGIVAARPLWYKPTLPVMFIVSAAAGGIATSILGTLIVGHLRGKPVIKPEIIRQAAIVAGGAMALYLYIKIWDWATTTFYSNVAAREQGLAVLRLSTPYNQSFWFGEMLLGGLIPLVIFLWPRLRRNDYLLMLASVLAILGVVLLRWNVTISGLVVPLDWSPGEAFLFPRNSYTPTLPEIGAFFGIVAYALMGFTLAARYLPIFAESHEH